MDRTELSLSVHGAEFYPKVLSLAEIVLLRDLSNQIIGAKPGARIYDSTILNELLPGDGKVGKLVHRYLGTSARPVRAVMFDKSADINWALSWHQDRTIAVRNRVDTEGFGPWTLKAGCVHVEPPFSVTRQMITLRMHLDDIDGENAPLLVAPGSHEMGRIPAAEIASTVEGLGCFQCLAEAGDVWMYSTGILHASDKAANPRRRRVLQADFSNITLPGGLQWAGINGLDRG